MKSLWVDEVAAMAGGELVAGDAGTEILAVSTDTRTLSGGSLFVALSGERFDGHDYVRQAVAAKAAAVLVHRDVGSPVGDSCAVIRVADTLTGLQELARAYRKLLSLKAVVITGSNGKTSTKDMVCSVLEAGARVTATEGNLNNHIGLPLTVLRALPEDVFGVWEIGMNHSGEIEPLANIARPDVGVITNIGTAHIGFMGSRDAIAREKGMLAEALPGDGCLILNAGDDYTSSLFGRTKAMTKIEVGFAKGDVQARDIRVQPDGQRFQLRIEGQNCDAFLPIQGRHMVSNALLAAAVGFYFGYPIETIADGFAAMKIAPGRLQELDENGIRFINDAYNANPDSMRASLSTVSEMEVRGRKFAVLGEMRELGDDAAEQHRLLGVYAREAGFDHVCSVGEAAAGITAALDGEGPDRALHFSDHEEAAAYLRRHARPGDLILLKGSRAAALEKVYERFVASLAP